MAEGTIVLRNHKDTVFNDLFSDKRYALSLFNAVNGTDFTDVDSLEVVSISEAIYMRGKNDVSVLFQNQLALWEHQSTLNYNMPLRGLIYYAHNIDGILKSKGVGMYGKKLVRIPTPDYYVFYNGRENAPDRQDLRLSDAFLVPREGYEWTAHMLNINAEGNRGLLNQCPALAGYVALIQYVREFQGVGDSLSEAMDKAIDKCVREGLLKEYLLKKKAEVKLMLLTEFDEELFEEIIRAESFEEGFSKGEENGEKKGEERFGQLSLKLVADRRTNDLERAVQDKDFRNTLYQQYGL